jgi:hypothetical protein
LEFFEADRAGAKLLLRDTYAFGERSEKHLSSIYERFIDDIDSHMVAAQERGTVISAPPRMVACRAAQLVGQLGYRRLTTDDSVTAAELADFVASPLTKGLCPDETTPTATATRNRLIRAGQCP